jgi:hypothetical protein
VLADQFQRNGVIFGLRFGVRNGTPVLSVEEERAALVASLKSLQRTRPGVSGGKGDPFARGNVDCRPYSPLRHPCCPIYPRVPCLTQGANWGRERYPNHWAGH